MRKLLLLVPLALLACGDDDTTDPGDGADQFTVSVVNNVFNPSTLSVPVGSNVTWEWGSTAGIPHNVTFEDGHPPSPDQTSGTYSRTFAATGDYAYVCTIHAAQGMAGVVSVTASTTGGTGGGGTGTGDGGGGGYP